MNHDSSLNSSIHEFIRHLLSAITGAALYTLKHPQINRLTDAAYQSLSKALASRHDVSIIEVDGELVIDGEPQTISLVVDRFIQVLREYEVSHIRLISGVTREETDQLIAMLSGQSERNDICSSEHIRFGSVEMPERKLSENEIELARLRGSAHGNRNQGSFSLKELSDQESARMSEIYEAVKRHERLKPSNIAMMVNDIVEAFKREGESILILAALREKDEYTFTHAANVCILTLAQAMSLGIKGQLLNDIGIASLLHDIGKMFIPEEILLKKENLTDAEFEIMKQHPYLGARYLMESPGVPRLASIVAFEHHLLYNKSGYPKVPDGWQQTIVSQMTAISDCFDAMRTRRPYKEPKSPKAIASMLVKCSGTEFNPLLVKNMLLIMRKLEKI